MVTTATAATWAIAGLATAGVIIRPFKLPEMIWAVLGAVALVASGLLPLPDAWRAVNKGDDVYLFLIGMMLLSEVARREGLFDWMATHAVRFASGSSRRLFFLIYCVGIVVTIFLSNDATAVVLTPAVFVAAKKAEADPLPYLFICAFIANAASFVLPISNPANLVLYGDHIPDLAAWVMRFALPSALAIAVTFVALWWVEARSLKPQCAQPAAMPALSRGGRIAFASIAIACLVLLTVSAFDMPLGLPTAILGIVTVLIVSLVERRALWPVLREVSWSILPLVAGLFVLVEALEHTGTIGALAGTLREATRQAETLTAASAGAVIALACNLMNNLPAGLLARSTLAAAHVSQRVVDSVLIGVDLGPNLSITGSLATILWLSTIRREGEDVTFWRFLKVGAIVMPPALLCAIAARLAI